MLKGSREPPPAPDLCKPWRLERAVWTCPELGGRVALRGAPRSQTCARWARASGREPQVFVSRAAVRSFRATQAPEPFLQFGHFPARVSLRFLARPELAGRGLRLPRRGPAPSPAARGARPAAGATYRSGLRPRAPLTRRRGLRRGARGGRPGRVASRGRGETARLGRGAGVAGAGSSVYSARPPQAPDAQRRPWPLPPVLGSGRAHSVAGSRPAPGRGREIPPAAADVTGASPGLPHRAPRARVRDPDWSPPAWSARSGDRGAGASPGAASHVLPGARRSRTPGWAARTEAEQPASAHGPAGANRAGDAGVAR